MWSWRRPRGPSLLDPALANLVLVDGSPLDDSSLLDGQEGHVDLIMKDGKTVVDRRSR